MIIKTGRAIQLERQGLETRERVFDYFQEHKSTMTEAAQALDLHVNTVSKHVKAINAGWRPEGWEE